MSLDGPHPGSMNFFFFNDTATTEIYTLSLHDALPISSYRLPGFSIVDELKVRTAFGQSGNPALYGSKFTSLETAVNEDRKSTRLNSSHANISYAVFCLKKKKIIIPRPPPPPPPSPPRP